MGVLDCACAVLFLSFGLQTAGLEHAKRCVMELIIWPLKRPDLFQGTRAPGKGLLLYGPPVRHPSLLFYLCCGVDAVR